MKKKLFKIAAVVCMSVSVMFAGQVTAFADEVKPLHEFDFDNDGTGDEWRVFDAINTGLCGISYGKNRDKLVTGYNDTGKARYFNGTDNCLQVPDYIMNSGAKSIRFKMKKEAYTLTGNLEAIITTTGGDFNNGYFIGIGSKILNKTSYSLSAEKGTLYIASFSGSKINFEIQTSKSVCDGQWHDVLFTWDGTQNTNSVKLYLDDMTTPIAQTTPSYENDKSTRCVVMGKQLSKLNDSIVKNTAGITKDNQYFWYNGYLDNVQFYDSAITPDSIKSSTLKATGGDSKVALAWNAVTDATSYTIKRSMTAGGPYTTIATDVTDTTYTDTDVENGTTYYYVVATIVDGRENGDSDEASATPNAGQATQPEDAKLKVVLEVAESLRLSVDDDLDVNTEMAWSSSDETVATVNEKGIVTALGLGNTVITVKSIDGSYTDSINVLVVENADDYRLAIDLKVGETSRLTVDDLTDTVNVTWAPMDSAIANVTSKGKVTALSKGLVLMTAKDEEGNIIGKVYVRVRE